MQKETDFIHICARFLSTLSTVLSTDTVFIYVFFVFCSVENQKTEAFYSA